jgi:antitoxin CcdA
MKAAFDPNAPKRAVNMTLNEDLVRAARRRTGNLSAEVEQLLAEWLVREHKQANDEQKRLDAALDEWNYFYDGHGSFADEHSTL